METRLRRSEWLNSRKPHTGDEEEICSISYDDTSGPRQISNISSFIKVPQSISSSKENVELSLEVEIADSLKRLIASPHQNSSPVLDVTIVRPTDLEDVHYKLDRNDAPACKNNEVRHLIASIERQKLQKKRLIEEYRKKVESSKINPINKAYEAKSNKNNESNSHLRQDDRKMSSFKHRVKRNENAKYTRNNITVRSAPTDKRPKAELLQNICHFTNSKALNCKAGQHYTNSTPMAILKPLTEDDIRKSINDNKVTTSPVGDYKAAENRMKQEYVPFSSTSDSNFSVRKENRPPTHQIYTTSNTYDKLRNLLTCQNCERKNEESEKPCMCQHCGMIGLLVESQKRPIVPMMPSKKPSTVRARTINPTKDQQSNNKYLIKSQKESTENRLNMVDLKTKCEDEQYLLIHDLSSRLEALEVRMATQEHCTVSKDYFKRIINKLWHRQNLSLQHIRMNQLARSTHLIDRSTQYKLNSSENVSNKKQESNKANKYRNVQIQQNTKKRYCVNPMFMKQVYSGSLSPSNISQENITESSKNIGAKTLSAISDLFTKKSGTNKKVSETNILNKGESSAKETFWRWGEEILKPGFDLKTKILSLLDEQFSNIKPSTLVNPEHVPSKSVSKCKIDKSKNSSPKTNQARDDTTMPSNLNDNHHLEKNLKDQKDTFQATSSQALKKMLDLMSEKIYKDHVKPTVDAIKQEHKTFNNENIKQIYNIRAAMDAALCKVSANETQTRSTTHNCESAHTNSGKRWRKNFFEPLEIPESIKHTGHVSKISKKSGIPVRVTNASPIGPIVIQNAEPKETKRSLIPRWKLPSRDSSVKPTMKNSSFVSDKYLIPGQKTKKHDLHEFQKPTIVKKTNNEHLPVVDTIKVTKHKPIQIKYMNPKAESWNEESCISFAEDLSKDNQVMLIDKSTKSSNKFDILRNNNREESRRMSQKHSLTDKIEFLTNITNMEMGKADIWNNILKQAKNHCRSKQDTVIIQIPTKTGYKSNSVGIMEVEFTIEDIQKLVNSSKLTSSTDINPQSSIKNDGMESFLLIKSRKILQEVHRRLENKPFKK